MLLRGIALAMTAVIITSCSSSSSPVVSAFVVVPRRFQTTTTTHSFLFSSLFSMMEDAVNEAGRKEATNQNSNNNNRDMCSHPFSLAQQFSLQQTQTQQLRMHPLESQTTTRISFRNRNTSNRREVVRSSLLGTAAAVLGSWTTLPSLSAAADQEPSSSSGSSSSFADIAARATQITQELDAQSASQAATVRSSTQTAYDFVLPVAGQPVKFADLIGQEFYPNGDVKVKAIIVVNIKQDDPVARKTIPELMALATKYGGRNSDNSSPTSSSSSLVVVLSPTDQGYYEPDTSALITLKLASEYGYGINPATVVTDKVNLLGTGAHPFWRWLQSTSRIPTSGIGRVQGNFENGSLMVVPDCPCDVILVAMLR